MFFDQLPGFGYVCAHRGARSIAPENTMLAAEKAVACGADFWELDVHKAADGTLIVFHDDLPDRTTDIMSHPDLAGHEPWATTAFTVSQLSSLDAGSWFITADPFKTIQRGEVLESEFAAIRGQRIPTLTEALEFTVQNQFPVNVEIKDQINSPGDLAIVKDVVELIATIGAREFVLISSFNHEYLREVQRLDSGLPLAALQEDKHPDDLIGYLRDLDVTVYHPDKALTDAALVRTLRAADIAVSPWTVNDMNQAKQLLQAGVFSVITDFPQSLKMPPAA